MLNVGELSWVFYSLQHPLAVLDMGVVVFDPRVKNVGKAVFSHKCIGEDPYTLENRVIEVLKAPHNLQIVNRIHLLFMFLNVI